MLVNCQLEGESRTRLLSVPDVTGERPKPQLEYHKILYKTATVFPPSDVLEGRRASSSKGRIITILRQTLS